MEDIHSQLKWVKIFKETSSCLRPMRVINKKILTTCTTSSQVWEPPLSSKEEEINDWNSRVVYSIAYLVRKCFYFVNFLLRRIILGLGMKIFFQEIFWKSIERFSENLNNLKNTKWNKNPAWTYHSESKVIICTWSASAFCRKAGR
jgi:hypothetical protein